MHIYSTLRCINSSIPVLQSAIKIFIVRAVSWNPELIWASDIEPRPWPRHEEPPLFPCPDQAARKGRILLGCDPFCAFGGLKHDPVCHFSALPSSRLWVLKWFCCCLVEINLYLIPTLLIFLKKKIITTEIILNILSLIRSFKWYWAHGG